jgi:hypothetical protein
MIDEQKQWYELVKHNFDKPDPATTKVVKKVRGRGLAERGVEVLDGRLTPEERDSGFGHYLRESDKPDATNRPRSSHKTIRRNQR